MTGETRPFMELNRASDPSGRRRFKLSLHEIYPDRTCTNLNGLCYLREYTQRNMDTVKGMPLCCEFADARKSMPLGHGETGVRPSDKMPLFENSIVVGAFDGATIEEIELDGQARTVLMGTGVLYEQRYPNLVNWIDRHMAIRDAIHGSVEFVGRPENEGRILYEDGASDVFRVPTDYQYSGYCLLTVPASDDSAVLLELNRQKEGHKLDEQMKSEINSAISAAFENLRGAEAELRAANEQLTGRIGELEAELNAAREQCAAREAEIAQLRADKETAENQAQQAASELNRLNAEAAISKLDAALNEFTPEQQQAAEAEINAYRAEPLEHAGEINAIVDKIQAAAYRMLKARKTVRELNNRRGVLSFVDEVQTDDPAGEDDPAKIFG